MVEQLERIRQDNLHRLIDHHVQVDLLLQERIEEIAIHLTTGHIHLDHHHLLLDLTEVVDQAQEAAEVLVLEEVRIEDVK